MPVVSAVTGSIEGPQQHKQPSRKGKKAWRKNIDVTEIEEGLDELNKEIISGGVIKELPSENLFVVDLVGDKSLNQQLPKHLKKTLRADEIIAERSAVPAVSLRKRPGDKTTDGLVPVKRQRTNWVTHKEVAQLRKVADGNHENTVTITDATYDVWQNKPEPPKVHTPNAGFIAPVQHAKVPKTMKQKPLSLTASGKAVPAVPKPSGGYSYNPAFDDYENRIVEESTKVVEAEKKRLEKEAAAQALAEAAARSAAEAEAAEARAELSEWDDDSAWEGFESGVEEVTKAKRPQRKTQAQRNRIKRRKEEEQRAKHEAKMKEKRIQLARAKEIAQEVAEKELTLALVRQGQTDAASDSEEADDNKLRRRQLGKFKLPERDLELVLPDELQDSLRLLKPEGNLLKDRYRSMLVRGRVESRRHLPFKKQAKVKLTEKWGHKDFHLF